MISKRKFVVAAAVSLTLGLVTYSMWVRHSQSISNPARVTADVNARIDDEAIAKALRDQDLGITDLTVRSAGPIVILRGKGTVASSEQATAIVKSMGVSRIANLISTVVIDDEVVRRDAERRLARTTSLDGCILKVVCEKGVLTVTGTVVHELQKDVARSTLRGIRGAREVKFDLSL